jgi:hypothetical protein
MRWQQQHSLVFDNMRVGGPEGPKI